MPSYISPFTGDVIQPTDVSYAAYTLTANLQLDWPSNTTPAEYPAARIMDITCNTPGLDLIMPPANQVSVGQDALIRNVGSQSFDVINYASGAIVTVAAGDAQYIYVTSNSTTAGTWGVIAFGIGSSGADANALAGLGLIAISTTLNQSHPASTLSALETLDASDRAQTKLWTSGAGTIYLPVAATAGNNWFTFLKNNGTGTLTVAAQTGETLDLQPSKTFQPDDAAIIICTGTEFVTVGYGQSSNFIFTALVKPVTGGSYILTSVEASSIIQEYVGSLTSNVTVVYPPVVGLYVISNQTTDNGYTLTITTTFGASIAVPAGNQITVICDGTNFYNANTVQGGGTTISLIDGSASTPSLNFLSETTTGMYRPAAGNIGFAITGSQRVAISATGINVTGSGTFTSGVAGGTF